MIRIWHLNDLRLTLNLLDPKWLNWTFLIIPMVTRLPTTDKRREMMGLIRGRDTSPELLLRRSLWTLGLRYRLHYRIGRSRPDIVFVTSRLAIFVDGCFWHGCPLHSTIPKNNREFWEEKLRRNRERDIVITERMQTEGWQVLRFWEHEIEASPDICARTVLGVINQLRGSRA